MLLYIVVALVKLFVFHSCTIDVFLRYVRIKKFIIIIIILITFILIVKLRLLSRIHIRKTCHINKSTSPGAKIISMRYDYHYHWEEMTV